MLAAAQDRFPQPLAVKVPQITALFWAVKVLTTGMGEAASDWLGQISIAVAGVVGLAGLGAGLWWQLRARRYQPQVYWFAVAMVAVFGTMAADGVHVALRLPYIASTVLYAALLGVVFLLWRRSEGTLSIHSILTRRRELFYWATVLTTFALGTAAGDLVAIPLHLGFLSAGLLFTGLILLPWIGWARFGLNEVAAFWIGYVLTRPIGASFADWLGKPPDRGGVGWGDGTVTAVTAVIIVGLVSCLAAAHPDPQQPATTRQPATDDAAT